MAISNLAVKVPFAMMRILTWEHVPGVSRNITLLDHPKPGGSRDRCMRGLVLTLIVRDELEITGKAEDE